MNDDDPLTTMIKGLAPPALDPALAARVLARARAQLEPAPAAGPVRLTLAVALVPGLLAAAAIDHVAETVQSVNALYGRSSQGAGDRLSDPDPPAPDDPA